MHALYSGHVSRVRKRRGVAGCNQSAELVMSEPIGLEICNLNNVVAPCGADDLDTLNRLIGPPSVAAGAL